MLRGCRLPVLITSYLLGLGACGHVDAPPAAAPPVPPPRRVARQLEASLAALSLPEELVLAARWKDPGDALRQVEGWSGGALDLDAWLVARLAQPSRPFDLTAPIELMAVLDADRGAPRLAWALSIGLHPGGAAPAEPRDVASPAGLACSESAALGSAAARLVCAGEDDQLARLLPHATRALPLAPLGEAALSLTLRGSPVARLPDEGLEKLASAWVSGRVGEPAVNERFEAQWAEVMAALAGELRAIAHDLDGASVEVTLRPREQALDVSALAPAAAGRSVLAQLMLGSGASGLAPEDFWRQAGDSDAAGFSWAFAPAPLAPLREPLASLLATLLDYRGVPRRLAQQARELVSYLPLPRGPVIHASGRLPPASGERGARAPWLEALGWQLLSVRGNFTEYEYYVGALARSYGDAILGAQFKRLIRSAFGPEGTPVHMQQRRPRVGGLPRGSFVWEVTFAAAEPGPEPRDGREPRAEWFGVFVPDEDGVRMAFGADERFLCSLLAQPARPRASTTLAGRAGLGVLNEHRMLAGGFVSLASLGQSLLAPPGSGDAAFGAQLAGAPHQGAAPIVYTLSQPSEAWLHLAARLGRDSLEDLLFSFGAHPLNP